MGAKEGQGVTGKHTNGDAYIHPIARLSFFTVDRADKSAWRTSQLTEPFRTGAIFLQTCPSTSAAQKTTRFAFKMLVRYAICLRLETRPQCESARQPPLLACDG